MPKILSIDFGLNKVGVAVSFGSLAVPLCTLRYKNAQELIEKIKTLADKEGATEIVIGTSEGNMAQRSLEFADMLASRLGFVVHSVDETLSTVDAIQKSIEAGHGPKKRKKMEDAYAAALILEYYLDN